MSGAKETSSHNEKAGEWLVGPGCDTAAKLSTQLAGGAQVQVASGSGQVPGGCKGYECLSRPKRAPQPQASSKLPEPAHPVVCMLRAYLGKVGG